MFRKCLFSGYRDRALSGNDLATRKRSMREIFRIFEVLERGRPLWVLKSFLVAAHGNRVPAGRPGDGAGGIAST